jgi:hypothetical protein
MALSIFYVYSPVIQQWPFNGATSKLDGNLGQTLANLHFWLILSVALMND